MRTKNALAISDISSKSVDVRACINRFLLSRVGSQFAAGEPELDAAMEQWHVPILMITPGLIVGQVGEARVAQQTHVIISHTPAEEIYEAAGELRKQHHAEIKAAFLRARKASFISQVTVRHQAFSNTKGQRKQTRSGL